MTPQSDNIDRLEIAKFEAVAPRWWDHNGDLKSLHDINPLRLGYIAGRVRLAGRQVLDVGCGGGVLSEALAKVGARVTGIDMGQTPLAVATLHARQTGLAIDYRRATVEELAASQPGCFDVLVCMELLEHVPDPPSIVRACGRLVRPGGDVFFATLNRTPKAFVFAIVGAEYLLRLLPRGTHSFARFVRPAELKDWGRQAGLAACDFTGMQYNPFARRYRLGGGLGVNYLAHFRRP
jgi:2-polyprenyl-6-hydroxyphenyl methylase/3-demethylubiquinone-9 3-methyltransferase